MPEIPAKSEPSFAATIAKNRVAPLSRRHESVDFCDFVAEP
jgi:hypothetical protein